MANTNRTEYKNDWQKEHTDRISLTVPKGHKAELQAHAEQHGEKLNAFIKRAINETIERDQTFARQREAVVASAAEHGVQIEDEIQLKRLTEAFSILEAKIPDIQSQYFEKSKTSRLFGVIKAPVPKPPESIYKDT